ncbi:hypothetical protein PT286_06930 [Neisseriaceae bacterium ESL0693]|nr:hypothetical protein [Neisseriaceae bacterium ESL0693]
MVDGRYGYMIMSSHSSGGVTAFNGNIYTAFLCKKNIVMNNISNIPK